MSYFNSAHFHKKLIKIAKKFENRFETNTSKKKHEKLKKKIEKSKQNNKGLWGDMVGD